MSIKLGRAFAALSAGTALAGAVILAGFAGFLLAGASMAVLQMDARAALPSARAENALLQRVLLKPDERFVPRTFTPREREEIERAVYEELERIQREPPSDAELQKVRNQIEANSIQRLTSNFGLAFQLSSSEALWMDWSQTFRDQAAQARVTAADVQRVAKQYFSGSNRTVGTLVRPPKAAAAGTEDGGSN